MMATSRAGIRIKWGEQMNPNTRIFRTYIDLDQDTYRNPNKRPRFTPLGRPKTIEMSPDEQVRLYEYQKRRCEQQLIHTTWHTFACLYGDGYCRDLQARVDRVYLKSWNHYDIMKRRVAITKEVFEGKIVKVLERIVYEYLGWWGRVPPDEPELELVGQPFKKMQVDRLRALVKYGCQACIEDARNTYCMMSCGRRLPCERCHGRHGHRRSRGPRPNRYI
jgi:hypothetical protein